jgi:hypothetical protein
MEVLTMSTRTNEKRDFPARITRRVARERRTLSKNFDEFSRFSERYGQVDLRTIVAKEAVIESVGELLLCVGIEVEVRRERGLVGKKIRKVSGEERRRLERHVRSNTKWGNYTSMASLLHRAGLGPAASRN